GRARAGDQRVPGGPDRAAQARGQRRRGQRPAQGSQPAFEDPRLQHPAPGFQRFSTTTRCRRSSTPTTPRPAASCSRSWPGTTTSGASPTACWI
ncbi:NAD-dependent glyceraldehyde-3-phosphate dehydrogenase (EC 1.2.1.12), partial [Pseudomonas sp. FEN]